MLFLSGLQRYQVKKINNLNSNPSIIEMGESGSGSGLREQIWFVYGNLKIPLGHAIEYVKII